MAYERSRRRLPARPLGAELDCSPALPCVKPKGRPRRQMILSLHAIKTYERPKALVDTAGAAGYNERGRWRATKHPMVNECRMTEPEWPTMRMPTSDRGTAL